MDDLETKQLLSQLADATAHAIKTNNPDVLTGFSYNLKKEIDDEVKRRRTIAERRNPRTVKELQGKSDAGLYTCKHALEAAEWDINKAYDIIKRGGL